MEYTKNLCLLWLLAMALLSIVGDSATASDSFSKQPPIITNVYATAYYCVYNSELAGTQTITTTISNKTYTLKASFLFGGWGVAMQGTGKTAPEGDYIKYTGAPAVSSASPAQTQAETPKANGLSIRKPCAIATPA